MNKVILLVLLISFSIDLKAQSISTNRDPRYNTEINPKYNYDVNPKYNSEINPKYNTEINPKYNSEINPKFNPDINPLFNTDVNLKYNSRINPFYISEQDLFNDKWQGLYLFNSDEEITGFLAAADSEVYLYYDLNGLCTGYFVKAESNFNLFSMNGEWTGKFLCSDSKNGYNLFDENGEWTKIYVK